MSTVMSVSTNPIIAIRKATADDVVAIRRLASLDSARKVPGGDLLVGVVDGEIRAALPIAGGRAIADPFHPTADLVAHLELRAERLRTDGRPTRPLLGRLTGGLVRRQVSRTAR